MELLNQGKLFFLWNVTLIQIYHLECSSRPTNPELAVQDGGTELKVFFCMIASDDWMALPENKINPVFPGFFWNMLTCEFQDISSKSEIQRPSKKILRLLSVV